MKHAEWRAAKRTRTKRVSALGMCFVSVLLTGLLSPTSVPAALTEEPSANDPAAWLFSPDAVVEIDLMLPQESLDALNSDPGEYQDGTFSLTTPSEEYGPFDVGIRLKGGFGSFRPLSGKAAFKIKLAHSVPGQRFFGLKTLTLNNMVQDPSTIHEVLAYQVFRSAGVAASRTGYAYVRVNDQDYGLYLNVETLDDVALSRWFESTQHLYEGEYGTDVSPGSAGDFSVDEGDEADLGDLEALIAAVNGGGDFSSRVNSVIDLKQLTRMWAVEKYIGHWDGYTGMDEVPTTPNNYYLHSDDTGVFRMLPWGTDQTWWGALEDGTVQNLPGWASSLGLPETWRLPFDGPDGTIEEEAGLLFNECSRDVSCFAFYRAAVGEVRSLVRELDLDSRAVRTAALLAPWQQLDPRREYSFDEIRAAVGATRAFLAARPSDVDAWLPTCRGIPATIVGTSGSDVRAGTPGRDVMLGLAGNDNLSGLGGNDVICGAKGNDTLRGGAGADTLLGQKGNDNILGNRGKDKLFGNKRNDTLRGGPGADTLLGQKGNDNIFGDRGKDKLFGNKGQDRLKGGRGKDLCEGGKGNDTASKCEVEKSI